MSDPNQDPRYRSRSHRPPASSQTTNQSAYSSSHPGQPVYAPYAGGAQESQLPGHSGSYSTSSHAPGGHTPHVPFSEAPQGQMSLQSRPAEYPETYPSHSPTTPYSTQVTPQDPYDSVGYQASGHAQGGHPPHSSFPGQPHRQIAPRGPPANYSAPSQTSPYLPGASPQGSYGPGGYQSASHAQGGYTPHPSYPGQPQPQRSVPFQGDSRGPPASYSPPSHTSPHLTGATSQGSYDSGGYRPPTHAMEGHTSHPHLPEQPQPPRSTPLQHGHSSAGPPAPYFSPAHTTPYSTAVPHQPGGQDLHSYTRTGGSSSSQNISMYPAGSSATSSTASYPGSGVQSSQGRSYDVTPSHTQDRDAAKSDSKYDNSGYR